jgi:23S rRNA (guanosine2251-2'-O)-methyltransferase
MKTDNKIREGFHSIEILLRNRPEVIKKVIVPEAREDARMLKLLQACADKDIAIEKSKKIKKNPQAIVSSMDVGDLKDLKNYLENLSDEVPTFVVLDNVIDPRNMGAIMRSSAIYGVNGIIINKNHCSPMTEVVHRTSSGGSDLLKVYMVSNLINCIKALQDFGIGVIGLSEHSDQTIDQLSFSGAALILGSEEKGIREKTLLNCDYKINLVRNDKINSLNVAVAAGIALSEIKKING